jgi:micrococcal nuclease
MSGTSRRNGGALPGPAVPVHDLALRPIRRFVATYEKAEENTVRVRRLAISIVVLALVAWPGTSSAAGTTARVTEITDGDTIDVALHGREEAIRLIGIDTPEVYFGEECSGHTASRSMERMLEPGVRVRLIRDRTQDNRDAYDRLLRYVEVRGRDVGRVQLRRGRAAVYVFEDPFTRVESYRRAERRAEAADAGVWADRGGDFHLPM